MTDTAAVVFAQVSYRFGRTLALDGLSFRLEPGRILGIVGSNGAGKTTTLRLVHGLLYPQGGRVAVLGEEPARAGHRLRGRVSLMSEEHSLYPWMRVGEILRLVAAVHPRWDPDLATSLRDRLQLDPKARIETLSRGTKAKVALIVALASRPELLLLDDPTAGLDPLVRQEVLEAMLLALPDRGTSVIYASHLIGEVERVADDVLILDGGRALFHGPLEDLKRQFEPRSLEQILVSCLKHHSLAGGW